MKIIFLTMIKNLAIWHGIIANSYVKDNKQFFDKVFGRWKDLDPSARKFYSTHMYLTIDLNNDTTQRKIIRDFDNMQYLYNIDNIVIRFKNATRSNPPFF